MGPGISSRCNRIAGDCYFLPCSPAKNDKKNNSAKSGGVGPTDIQF